jgi:ribonuclease HI
MNDFLYCDGGVIQVNPSPIGGTFAYRILRDGQVIRENGGVIVADSAQPLISNNLTEMLALVRGLGELPDDWTGTICSDSQITLGRAFHGWKWTNVPAWLRHEYAANRLRLVNWAKITPLLLSGHPTRAQLQEGIGKRGTPVSEHNVWCDQQCGQMAAEVLNLLKVKEGLNVRPLPVPQ